MPVEDVGAVGVEMAGGLAEEEGGDQRHEEHEIAGESGEDAHAVAGEQGAGAAAVAMVLPVLVAAATAGRSAIYGWAAAKSRISTLTISVDYGPGEGSGHGGLRTTDQLTPVGMPSPTAV